VTLTEPSLGSADERAEHQFQDRPLAEGIGDDFEAPALLDEETLEQIRGSNPPPMRHWEAQMGDARFEVIPEARHCPVMLAAVVGHDASGKLAGNRTARRLISRLHTRLELRPYKEPVALAA